MADGSTPVAPLQPPPQLTRPPPLVAAPALPTPPPVDAAQALPTPPPLVAAPALQTPPDVAALPTPPDVAALPTPPVAPALPTPPDAASGPLQASGAKPPSLRSRIGSYIPRFTLPSLPNPFSRRTVAAATTDARSSLKEDKSVQIAGELVYLFNNEGYLRRHPEYAGIDKYFSDTDYTANARFLRKFFGSSSDFLKELYEGKAICNKDEKDRLIDTLERRLTLLREEILKFVDKEPYTLTQTSVIKHALKLIELIKKIHHADGECVTYNEDGSVSSVPKVDTERDDRIKKIVEHFAFIVLKSMDPVKPDENALRMVKTIEDYSGYDEAYILGFKNKPAFITRILGLAEDIDKIRLEEQVKLLEQLKAIMPDVEINNEVSPIDNILNIITAANGRYEASLAEIDALRATIARQAAAIADLEFQLGAAETAYNGATKSRDEAEAAATAAVAATAVAEGEREKAILAATEAKQAAEAAAADAEGQLTDLRAKLATANEAKVAAEDALKGTEAESRSSEAALAAANAATKKAEEERDEARAELAAQTAALATKVAELEALKAGKSGSEAANAGLTEEIDRLKATLAQSGKDLEAAREAAANAAQTAANRIAALEKDLRDSVREKRQLEGDLQSASNDYEANMATASKNEARIKDLEQQIEALNKQLGASTAVGAQLTVQKGEIDSLKRELEATRAADRVNKGSIDASQSELQRLRAALAECNAKNEAMRANMAAEIENATRRLNSQIRQLQAENEQLKGMENGELIHLRENSLTLERNLEALQKQIDPLRRENERLINENRAASAFSRELLEGAAENGNILKQLAEISENIQRGAPFKDYEGSTPLKTLVERINVLRGNQGLFNKNICFLSKYIQYFMELLFTGAVDKYRVIGERVDAIMSRGPVSETKYSELITLLMTFIDKYPVGKKQESDALFHPMGDYARLHTATYNTTPEHTVINSQLIGLVSPQTKSPIEIAPYKPLYERLKTFNLYTDIEAPPGLTPKPVLFILFVVACQKYMAYLNGTRRLPCALSRSITDPASGLGSYGPTLDAQIVPTPAAQRTFDVEPRDDQVLRQSTPVLPQPIRSVSPTQGTPISKEEAARALKTLEQVAKVLKGGRTPPGSQYNREDYLKESNRPNQAILNRYCAYKPRDAEICNQYDVMIRTHELEIRGR